MCTSMYCCCFDVYMSSLCTCLRDVTHSLIDRQDLVSKNELMEAMLRLKKLPDETKLAKIAEVLDEDKDGIIGLSEALKVSAVAA